MPHAVAQKASKDNAKAANRDAGHGVVKRAQAAQRSWPGATIQRKPGCACGGGCPRCQEEQAIQTKLAIGKPDDKYEREADRVADQVMWMPDSSSQPIQRKYNKHKEEPQIKPTLQLKANGESIADATLESHLQSSKGNGNPLPAQIQAELGSKMGADFSGVKVHTDSRAVELNRQLGAKAFTQGRDIYFNEGEYNPTSRSGKRLLAHELTHVVQQRQYHNSTRPLLLSDTILQSETGSIPGLQLQVGEVAGVVGVVFAVATWTAGQGGGNSLLIDPTLNRIAPVSPEREDYRYAHPFRKQGWTIFDRSWDNLLEREASWSVDLWWQFNGAELTDVHLDQSYAMGLFDDTSAKLIMIDNQASNKRIGFRCEFEYDELGVGHRRFACDGWISADGSAHRTEWSAQDA